jgi:hypothetical protein
MFSVFNSFIGGRALIVSGADLMQLRMNRDKEENNNLKMSQISIFWQQVKFSAIISIIEWCAPM